MLKMPALHPDIGQVRTAENCMDAAQNFELVASLDLTITSWCKEIEKVRPLAFAETLRFVHNTRTELS